MTPEQRDILRHSLGLDKSRKSYRNHFCTGIGSADYANCEALVSAGLMVKRAGNQLSGGDDIYFVTEAGIEALK